MSERVVIGELSARKLFALPVFFAAACILEVLLDEPGYLFNGVIAVAALIFAVVSYCRPNPGLYIEDGHLHESVLDGRKPLDDIRLARRTTCYRSMFRNLILIETGVSGLAPTPGAIRTAPKGYLYVPTTFYKTPAAEMLDRLSDHGIRIVGSRTKLLDLF